MFNQTIMLVLWSKIVVKLLRATCQMIQIDLLLFFDVSCVLLCRAHDEQLQSVPVPSGF